MIGAAIAGFARLIAGGSVQWSEPPRRTPRVYFANHTSHLDFVLVWSYLPADLRATTRPVAARDYWDSSRFRRYLAGKVFRALLIDRAGPDARTAVARMTRCLAGGESLILFPEGTRGPGDELQPFKSGLYHLSEANPEAELVPVAIENLNRILPKGEFLPVPMVSRVAFGPALRLEEGEAKDEFLARARAALAALREA